MRSLVAVLAGFSCAIAAAAEPGDRVDFDREIRPVLADRCFGCHGPDRGARKAKLRLDRREGVLGQVGAGMAQQHWAAGLGGGLRGRRAYSALEAMVDREQRDLGYFQVGVNDVEAPELPSDDQLQAFMQENADQLTQPEYRVLSLVRFAPRPQDLDVEVTQEQLQERFEFRRDTLSQPETRTLVQIPAKDQAAATRIAQRLREGEDPAAVARDLGVDPILYEGRPRTAIADRKVAEAAFALAAGEVLATFPTAAAHILWVATGSDGVGLGNPYGDQARGRIVEGGMPAWGDVLTVEEIIGVVLHERARLSGSTDDADLAQAIDDAVHLGELDLQGHLDPTTVTVDEIQELLDSVADGGH